MATTKRILAMETTGKAIGRRGNGGRSSLRVRLAAGVVALGCAAALTLGGLRAGDGARSQPVAGGPGLTLAAPAIDYASDLGTNDDPFVISNSRPRHVARPAPDYASDLGTAFDPFVISNSQARYLPTGSSEDNRGPVLPCWVEELIPGETLYQGVQVSIASLCQR